jgi:hypothetical protein
MCCICIVLPSHPSSMSSSLCVFECIEMRGGRHVCCACVLIAAAAHLANTRAQRGHSALMIAAMFGRADCVRLLVDAGADKEAKNEVCDS